MTWNVTMVGTADPPPGRIREGSDQQEALWADLLASDRHKLWRARAGCGKTSSFREGAWRLTEADPRARITMVAFNTAIADDNRNGLPPRVESRTMHSLGRAVIARALGDPGEPRKYKKHDIVDTLLPRRGRWSRSIKAATVRLASLCQGYLLDGRDPAALTRLAARHGVCLAPTEPDDRKVIFDLVPKVLEAARAQAHVIDFDDMIWLPVQLGLPFPEVDVLGVDEAQDLSPAQHRFVELALGTGTMVVIGDDRQAIYSFRGADGQSLDTLADRLEDGLRGLVEFPLTRTRRCPRSHVDLARTLVPDFEAFPDAPGGRIDEDEYFGNISFPGLLVLCRTNAPLLSACYSLIGEGKPVAIQGRAIGDGLVRLIESLEPATVPELLRKAEVHRAAEAARLAELENADGDLAELNDQVDALIAVSRGCDAVDEVIRKIRSLFVDLTRADEERCVTLSSIHRAKGRERDHVAILRPDLLPHPSARTPEEALQEENLAYVAATRARKRLSFLGPIPDLFD